MRISNLPFSESISGSDNQGGEIMKDLCVLEDLSLASHALC